MSNLKTKSSQKHFKKIALVGKYQADGFAHMLLNLANILKNLGCEVFLEAETASNTTITQLPSIPAREFESNIDLVIVLGGDGTMLGIARQIAGQNVPLIGINMGTLGYMTDIPLQDVELVLTEMLNGQYESDVRYLLEAKVIRDTTVIGSGLALNDVVVNRSGFSGMLELTVRVNDQFMYNQRSDGLIVATPTGSTAYSMSAGGPILHPSVAGVVLAPIAPHALSNRPIVLPSDSLIAIELVGGKDVTVNFDMQSLTQLQIGDVIAIKRSQKTITLLHPIDHSDYRALRQKLHWNEYPSSF
jgi:NAD+ kinase